MIKKCLLSFWSLRLTNLVFRFTTPSPALFNRMMKKLNILESNQVVFYNGISTAKAWFIMKYYGHPSSRILNGGIREWNEKGYPINIHKSAIDYTTTRCTTFTAKEPKVEMLIDYTEVLEKIGSKCQAFLVQEWLRPVFPNALVLLYELW